MNREKMAVESGMTPAPRDLLDLAEVMIGTSRQNGIFRQLPKGGGYLFCVGDFDEYYQYPSEIQPKTVPYMGKVAKNGFHNWTLSIYRSHHQEVGENVEVYRVGYVFDWTKTKVNLASRIIIKDFADGHVKPGVSAYEDYVDPDLLQIDYLNTIHEVLRVSVADCEYLKDEIRKPSDV